MSVSGMKQMFIEDVGICKLQAGQSIVLLVTENKEDGPYHWSLQGRVPLNWSGRHVLRGCQSLPTVLRVYGF